MSRIVIAGLTLMLCFSSSSLAAIFMTGDDDSSGPSSPGQSSPGQSSPGPSSPGPTSLGPTSLGPTSESVSDEPEPEPAPTTSSGSAALQHQDLPDLPDSSEI